MPEWLSSLRLRLTAVFRRRQLDRELDDELAFHLAMREEQLRRAGAEDASGAARRKFGNPTRIRESLYDAWAIAPAAGALLRDCKYSTRTLARSPAFASVIVLTLALGIGANTAIFSVVNAVLIRPLGYADADRLVSVLEGFPDAGLDRLPFSALDFEDLLASQGSYSSLAAYRNVALEISGGGPPERVAGAKVSAALFETLGARPAIGRTFSAQEDRPGANVAVLSWGLWQRRFGASPSVLGGTIQLDRKPHVVVGVMPARFVFPQRGPRFNSEPADVWVPLAFTDRERFERGSMHVNSVIGRLHRGVWLEAARAELDVLQRRIASSYPPPVLNAGFSPHLYVEPLRDEITGRFEAPLAMLLAAVGLVLLVACANVGNLVLSRATRRRYEFAIRLALGARRGQLVQLLLCEALLLSCAGGAIGLAVAYWLVTAAPAVLTRTIPGLHDIPIDVRVLAFTAAMSVGTAVVFALMPARAVGHHRPADSLRDEPVRATAGSGALRVQGGFVVATVSLACVLLIAAGLFVRSFAALLSTDLGFRPAKVLTASTTLPGTFYTSGAQVRTFHESLRQSLAALPGVRQAAIATDLPLAYYDVRAFTAAGVPAPAGVERTTRLTWVHGPYFEALGMTLRRGRYFSPHEHEQIRGVVIVNEKLAALVWPGQDPIGKQLKWGGAESRAPWLTVVGVLSNVADGPIGSEPGVHAYEPFRQLQDFFLNGAPTQFGRDVKVAVLTDGDPRALVVPVHDAITRLDPDLAVERLGPMEDQVGDMLAPRRFSTLLVGVFAAVALLLASMGLYGLMAFTTAQRQKEIAVRLALGAERGAVIRMVVGQGARLVGVGLFLGVLASMALVHVLTSLLYETSPYDRLAFAVVPAVLVPAALLACALPAWRAARVEPTVALRID